MSQQGLNRGTTSSQRLVLCECNACKAENPTAGGSNIPKSLQDYHMKSQRTRESVIAQRGRGSSALTPRLGGTIALNSLMVRGRGIPSRIRTFRGTRRGVPSTRYDFLCPLLIHLQINEPGSCWEGWQQLHYHQPIMELDPPSLCKSMKTN